MITLYLRREQMFTHFGMRCKAFQVVAYTDRAGTDRKVTYRWHSKLKPTKGCKTITFNCFRWSVEWLDDLLINPEAAPPLPPQAYMHGMTIMASR